ncbi:hypothetical protein MSAN_02111200 [Mycena sanguinolenta]|uniref:Restriction of telomere capping protein 4 C-terminal domain-containing protein n=1 Tax=Mycena sanguinolenta TaxID=230812 RepID=A0A8H6XI25_9AGAR|nr:hypothetical protein MSAN_02111200 [Mycena sanguinolenta]
MANKSKKTAKVALTHTEEMHRMREQIKKQDEKIAMLERERDAARAAGAKKKDLIPRPKGDEIATIAPFFARFEGFWPVHDIIGTYLLNMQNRRRRDLKKEKEADERDARGEGSDNDHDSASDDDNESDAENSDEDARTPIPPKSKPRPKRVVAKKRIDSASDAENVEDADNEDGNEHDVGEQARDVENGGGQTKRKASDTPIIAPPPKKIKTTTATSSVMATPLLPSSGSGVELSYCPATDCLDELPSEPSPRIISLLLYRQDLHREFGSSAPGIEYTNLEICAAIRQESNLERFYKLGRANKWPQTLDLANIVFRVLALGEYLDAMIRNPELLAKSQIWEAFVKSIDSKIFEFSNSSRKADYTYAMLARRCGYYGPRGQFLINSTIARMLSQEENALGYALYDTLNRLLHHSNNHDQYDRDSELIDINAFTFFILTPFAATILISEDMNVDLDHANDIRDASAEFGEIVQHDYANNQLLFSLHAENMRQMGSGRIFFRPPQHRRAPEPFPASHIKREEPSMSRNSKLSLADFIQVRLFSQVFVLALLCPIHSSALQKKPSKLQNKPPLVRKSEQLPQDDVPGPEIEEENEKSKLKEGLVKGNKSKKSKKNETLSLDDFDEPDLLPPKKKSKKEVAELTPPKPRTKKDNPIKSDYGTRAKKAKAAES